MVEPPDLFTQEERQTLLPYAAGRLQPALQVSPEALDAVGVHRAFHIQSALVIDALMREVPLHPCIAGPPVRVHDRVRREVRLHDRKQGLALEVRYRPRDDLPGFPGAYAEYGLFARPMPALRPLAADAPRLVAPLAADEGLVDLHDARERFRHVRSHETTQVVKHPVGGVALDAGRLSHPLARAVAQEGADDRAPRVERGAEPGHPRDGRPLGPASFAFPVPAAHGP